MEFAVSGNEDGESAVQPALKSGGIGAFMPMEISGGLVLEFACVVKVRPSAKPEWFLIY